MPPRMPAGLGEIHEGAEGAGALNAAARATNPQAAAVAKALENVEELNLTNTVANRGLEAIHQLDTDHARDSWLLALPFRTREACQARFDGMYRLPL
jgi:hypothetical protein